MTFGTDGCAIVGFEDLFGGGDRDYDDNRFRFCGGIAPEPPKPRGDFYMATDNTIDFGRTLNPGDVHCLRLGFRIETWDRNESLWASSEPTGQLTCRLQAVDVSLDKVWRCSDITMAQQEDFDPALLGELIPVTEHGYATTTFGPERHPDLCYGIAWRLR